MGPPLRHELLRFTLQTLALLLGVGAVLALTIRRAGKDRPWRAARVGAASVAVVTVVLMAGHVPGALTQLDALRAQAVSARAGRQTCLAEDGAGRFGPYFGWLRAHLPSGAAYTLAPSPLDGWCVTLNLLPAVLAGDGQGPQWLITFGSVPAGVASQSARVLRYAPGFLLVREPE